MQTSTNNLSESSTENGSTWTSSVTLSDKENRKKLSEGRNYQMGFAFCRKDGDGKFSTIQPFSACKDYLNDVVYSEMTGKPVHAYGLGIPKKLGVFNEKDDEAYLAIKILEYWGGGKYPTFDKDVENLKTNYKNLQKFLNFFEEKKGLKTLTDIIEVNDNQFLIRVPMFWCRATYLISVYSLLIRTGQFWDGTTPPDEFIKVEKNRYSPDTYMMSTALPKLEKILTENLPPQDMSGFFGGTDVHNFGIVAVKL